MVFSFKIKNAVQSFIFIFINITFAQSGIIHYNKLITNESKEVWATPHVLYFNNNESFYIRTDSGKKLTEVIKDGELDKFGRITSSNVIPSKFNEYYYINKENNEIIFKEKVVEKTYKIKNKLESINWVLLDEKKEIDGFTCQKATAIFRGRDYTAWFTIEIPVDIGPWKLRGLPGLIMDVSESTGKFRFRVSKIDLNPDESIIKEQLKKPDIKKVKNFEVYKNAIKNAFDDQMSIARTRMPKGATLLFKGPDCDHCPDPKNYTLERFE
ncbi:GLPGLI family protein [Aquimarina sp. I32.4]|uniref:GLPGLI family protein n=1 Tax=Aquimarina sp. I32.4 TaxID=2053903 RepID=UPI000CDEDA31|nr:GLPGLI family protein [Aquimarina sp. I32.4]